jgi:cytochrome b561
MESSPYRTSSILLHWLMAIALVANFALGVSVHEMDLSPMKLKMLAWHKWAGMTLLALVTLRLINRLVFPPPPPEPAPRWQQHAASLAHAALYVLMFAIPVSGWLVTSAAGIPVIYLNLWELPQLLPKNLEWADQLKEVHEALNQALLALVIVHVLAAIKHHVVDRDSTLIRMLPFLEKRR